MGRARLFASSVYSVPFASCARLVQAKGFEMSLLTALKRWSRTSQEATTAKAVQVWSDFTAYVMAKTCFSVVFITLLHYRVAEVPRKWSWKTALSTWQHHLGYATVSWGGFSHFMALNFTSIPPWPVLQLPILRIRAGHPTCQAQKMALLVDTNTQVSHSGSF